MYVRRSNSSHAHPPKFISISEFYSRRGNGKSNDAYECIIMHALKAGGRGFESQLSSLFSMKIEKRALRFVGFEVQVHMQFAYCFFVI